MTSSPPDPAPSAADPGRAERHTADAPDDGARPAVDRRTPGEGVPLWGGTANFGRVLRVGDTVQRPRGPHTPAVHDLLRHLERSGFTGAPRVLPPDGGTRPAVGPAMSDVTGDEVEVLGYIEGATASEPLPDWAGGDDALASVGTLLRSFHDHAADFDPGVRRWQRPVPPAWRGDLVCHNDVNPANVVFRDAEAVALIDFDLAAPASRAWDLALTACFWVPLRDDVDLPDRHRSRQALRFGVLMDAYGASPALAHEVTRALVPANGWIAGIIKEAARRGHPAFGRVWQRRRAVHARAGAWLAAHAGELGPARAVRSAGCS